MGRLVLLSVIGTWLAVPFDGVGSEPQLTVHELLTKVADRAQQQNNRPPRREFIRRKTTLELDKKHNVIDREELIYRMVIIDGKLYPRLLEKNGRALTPEEQAKEEEKEAAFRNEPEKKSKKQEGNTVLLKLSEETAKRFNYEITGHELVEGRDSYVVTVTPKPGLHVKGIEEQVMARISGRLWIDTKDYEISKLEVHLLKPVGFGLGLLGSVNEFEFYLFRKPLPDGDWENSLVKLWVQFRILLDTTRIQYEERVSPIEPGR